MNPAQGDFITLKETNHSKNSLYPFGHLNIIKVSVDCQLGPLISYSFHTIIPKCNCMVMFFYACLSSLLDSDLLKSRKLSPPSFYPVFGPVLPYRERFNV